MILAELYKILCLFDAPIVDSVILNPYKSLVYRDLEKFYNQA